MPREETNLVSGSNAIVLRGPISHQLHPYITGRVSRETSSSFGTPTVLLIASSTDGGAVTVPKKLAPA